MRGSNGFWTILILLHGFTLTAGTINYSFIELEQNFLVGNIDFSDNGRYLVSFAGMVSRVDVETGQVISLDSNVITHLGGASTINGDGGRVAFNGRHITNAMDGIFVYDFNSSELIPLVESNTASFIVPSISGDGNRVLFVSDVDLGNNSDGSQEMFLADINLNQVFQLTDNAPGPNVITHYPSGINYDGSKVCFNNDIGGMPPGLYLWEEGGLRMLTDKTADDPAMSQDGTAIVFSSVNPETGFHDLYIYDLLTDTLTLLAEAHNFGTHIPEISGDGQWVTVMSTANFSGQNQASTVYVISRQGEVYPLAESLFFLPPRISYNGDRILFWQGDFSGGALILGVRNLTVPLLSNFGLVFFVLILMAAGILLGSRQRRADPSH